MPFRGLLPHCSFFIVRLLACHICLPALITIACDRTVDRPVPSFTLNRHGSRVAGRGHHPAPHRMPFSKRSFFLATTAIEFALSLGYDQSQYTGNWTNVINTTFGGAAGDILAFIVPRGTVFQRTFSLPRGIVTVSIRSLGARGVSHRLVGVMPWASRFWSSTLSRRALAKSEHFVQVPVCLLVEPAALGEPETASCQLATGRRAGDKTLLPPPTPQRTVLLLLPCLRIKPPPGRCRWWRASRRLLKHFNDAWWPKNRLTSLWHKPMKIWSTTSRPCARSTPTRRNAGWLSLAVSRAKRPRTSRRQARWRKASPSARTVRLTPCFPHLPMILPLGQNRRRWTTTTPTRRTRPLRTMATGRQARRRPQVVPRRATARASRTQQRASAQRPSPNVRSDFRKQTGSRWSSQLIAASRPCWTTERTSSSDVNWHTRLKTHNGRTVSTNVWTERSTGNSRSREPCPWTPSRYWRPSAARATRLGWRMV